VNHFNCSEI